MRTAPTILTLLALAGPAMQPMAAPAGSGFVYQYNLADFDGVVPFMGVRIRLDEARDEAYVLHGNAVRIFSSSGMETYSFLLDPALGVFVDLAIDADGDIYALGYKPERALEGRDFFILRCDYRGEPKGDILPAGLPAELESFGPDILVLQGDRFYLASFDRFLAVILDRSGALQQVVDLAALAGLDEESRANSQLGGFAVDREGRLVFSIPTDFSIRLVTADGSQRMRFGESGSRPGQFGVVGAVATDTEGNIFVVDKLRSVVLVFDRDLKFATEFGRYGNRPENLVIPSDVAVSPSGKLFVSQMRKRGVSVFTRATREGRG